MEKTRAMYLREMPAEFQSENQKLINQLGTKSFCWYCEIKTCNKRTGYNYDDSVYLSDEREQRRNLMSMVKKFWVLYKANNCMIT